VVYGILKLTMGLKMTPEEEYEGADLSVHKISATPDREASW
jgi:Amt family ammonium transporter